ncbi:SIP1 domain-containing protein [Aspergillus clavatus NRRL 1]|uniref:V-SNARE n=1 Tax=Aspergillus clavatus (strain ATCC 1007 / CBS 513.65 / DSM 816 / NCTC 3887 / NRRL 1 / QM 1276 / 107) TaxID=344612 RepID=A1CF72_ASPCL|nr:uncharacterized protein ACLA_092190 [Aspergillus clavatus NRRL 1]EAW11521.1 conserved hypothetical protein [Aspergillus clavatus NRRL 1]
MPEKRKPPTSASGTSPYSKRFRPSYREEEDADEMAPTVTPYERPRNHPVYGQKSAFPGLDVGGDDELFYGPAEDGMEYLRMVRSEANSLPILFTAPKAADAPVEQTSDESGAVQQPQPTPTAVREGFFADGVYVAPSVKAGDAQSNTEAAEDVYSDAQSSYYNLLHHRFLLLRSILKCTPPSTAIAVLDDSHPISFPRHSKTARKEWRRLLLVVDPQTVQLACMDMDSVLGVLGIMARLMSENVRSGDAERVRRIGAWAWGLLAKCRDVGQLGTEEVGDIRDLGKRAVKILHKMREEDERTKVAHRDGELSNEESDDEENLEDTHEPAEDDQAYSPPMEQIDHVMQDVEEEPPTEDLETAKARLQAMLSGNEEQTIQTTEPGNVGIVDDVVQSTEGSVVEVAIQTRAMLDMIITVVGEYFGQKDLLKEREFWNDSSLPATTV